MCTSNAYAHSTLESAAAECDGGARSTLFEKILDEFSPLLDTSVARGTDQKIVATAAPTRRKSRRIMSSASLKQPTRP